MVKRHYYSSFLDECIEANGDKDICIWGARRTGRALMECILEKGMYDKSRVHLIDRDLCGQEYIINDERIIVEKNDEYLKNKDFYYIICAAENPNTARVMNELLFGIENVYQQGKIKENGANFWFYIDNIVLNDPKEMRDSMEEYNNLSAVLHMHQKYVSDFLVEGEYFNSALFTTKIGCPVKCKYCPQDVLVKEYKKLKNPVMDITFERFRDMLKRIPQTVIISFTGFVEPFANPECVDMVLYALNNGYIVRVYTTIFNLTIDDYIKFKDYPNLKTFDVHIPDSNGNTVFPLTEHYKKTLKYIVDNPPLHARFLTNCLGINSQAHYEIRDIISPEGNPIDSVHGLVYDNRLSHGNAKLKCHSDCSRIDNPQAGLGVVLPNGDVVACNKDWGLTQIIGNIFDVNDWSELMESDVRKRFREALDNPRVDNICTYCELAIEVDQGDMI